MRREEPYLTSLTIAERSLGPMRVKNERKISLGGSDGNESFTQKGGGRGSSGRKALNQTIGGILPNFKGGTSFERALFS